MTIVEAAAEEREELLKKCRRSPDSFDACFRVWAVFDRDEHPQVREAIDYALSHGVDIAYSNPCFELWPLLHIEDYGSQDGRHAVQKKLEAKMPGYNHEDQAIIDFPQIENNFQVAYERAKRLQDSREKEGDKIGCPVTTVGELVHKIIQNGKSGFARRSR